MRHLLSLLLTLTFISSTIIAQNEKNWANYETAEYKVQFPKNWEIAENIRGSEFILSGPTINNFNTNINLLKQDLTTLGNDVDLEGFTKLSISQIEVYFENAEILLSETLKGNDRTFQRLIYSADYAGRTMQFEQYYWVFDNTAFVLTLTASKEDFEAIKEEGETIMNSLIIK